MTIENEQNQLKLERLYYEYRYIMYSCANEILHDKYLTEDAVHQSFIRIMKNLHKIDEDNRPRTCNFLVIICRNVAKDIYNKRLYLNKNNDPFEELDDNITGKSNDPMDILITKESIERITKSIQSLDPIYRDVLLLKRVYNFSREEIADLLGISIETVKKRIQRAKNILSEKLAKEESI
jgi:RNA polymerase sigma-70 factor (ECF subfamily)